MNKLPSNPLPFTLKGCYLAGGAILSIVTKTDVSDYDIYPKSTQEMIDIFYQLYDEDCFIVNVSDRAVTYKCNSVTNKNGERIIVQVMTFDQFDSPEKIFQLFDFSVCMAAFDTDTEQYHFGSDFWQSVASRTLYFNPGTKYPLNSAIRVSKYTAKGYYLPKPESVKLSLAVINSGMPESWSELESAIGGSYGRQLTLSVGDLEYSYQNALNVLDKIALDYALQDTADECSKITPEILEQHFKGDSIKTIVIKGADRSLSFDQKYRIENGIVYTVTHEEDAAYTLLGIQTQELDPETRIFGYKLLKRKEDGSYENVINTKKLNYKLGEVAECAQYPNIYLWPETRQQAARGDQVLCKFSFQIKDLLSVSSSEYRVTKTKFEEVIS